MRGPRQLPLRAGAPQGVLKLTGHGRTQPGLGHCPCLCQGHLLAIPGNAKIPSSHRSSHFDICGLGRTEERNSHTGSTASRGSSAKTQETSKQEATPVLLPRVVRQPGCPDTAWATRKPQHRQVHTAMSSVQTRHSSATHSSRLQTGHPGPALRNRVSAAPA